MKFKYLHTSYYSLLLVFSFDPLIDKKFYTALFPPCMAYKRLHRSTSLRKHCASL